MKRLAEKMYKNSKLNITQEEYITAAFYGLNLSLIFTIEISIGLIARNLLFPVIYFPLSLYMRKHIICYHSKSMIGCFFITIIEYLIGFIIYIYSLHIFPKIGISFIKEILLSSLSTIIIVSFYGGFSKSWMK